MIKALGQKLIELQDAVEVGEREDGETATADSSVANADIAGDKAAKGNKDGSFQELISTANIDNNKVFSLRSQNLSFEVDYNAYETRFWPRVR